MRKEILKTEAVPSPCCQGIIKLRALLFKSNLYKEESELIGSSLKKVTVMAQLQTVQVLRIKHRKRFLWLDHRWQYRKEVWRWTN